MIIYPAIDIRNGQCVRLFQGDFNQETVYSSSPLDVAQNWEKMLAEYIHIVDLDGAKSKDITNLNIKATDINTQSTNTNTQPTDINAELISNAKTAIEIAGKLKIPVQFGGGIRSMEKIGWLLSNGIERIILGTSAVKDQELLKNAVKKYGARIAVGIDAKDGLVAIEGWSTKSEFRAVEFAKTMQENGVTTIIYTDISRDGTLIGPNLFAMQEMVNNVSMDVIASGGVSVINDIIALQDVGVKGVIVGKALYTGNINLREAIQCLRKE